LAVSRADTDGSIVWTSMGLSALAGVKGVGLGVSEVALGNDDAIFVAMSIGTNNSKGSTVVFAFDPATGKSSWVQIMAGGFASDLRVRPDGSIVMSRVSPAYDAVGLTILAPTGELVRELYRRNLQYRPVAVAADGGLLLAGIDSLTAITPDGGTLWQMSMALVDATITTDGMVIAADDSTISAIDFSSGDVAWTIPAPSAGSCILGIALTSDSTVIGVQCDGTIFGAGD
jgi:outer membrane protein assembly factor BamB